MRTISLWILAASLVGCGNFTSPKNDDRPTYNGLKNSVEQNRALWASSAPLDYSYELNRLCFCGMRPYKVTVQGGQIFKVETKQYDKDGAETVIEVAPDSDPDILSIDQVFAQAAEFAERRPDHLDVIFDPTYHFPAEIAVNHRDEVADDELTLKVEAFVRQ